MSHRIGISVFDFFKCSDSQSRVNLNSIGILIWAYELIAYCSRSFNVIMNRVYSPAYFMGLKSSTSSASIVSRNKYIIDHQLLENRLCHL